MRRIGNERGNDIYQILPIETSETREIYIQARAIERLSEGQRWRERGRERDRERWNEGGIARHIAWDGSHMAYHSLGCRPKQLMRPKCSP